uniref:Methionyl-tRNA synthetase n=1 Tax=Nosema pernyi TaxID=1112939 RepID=A0A0N7ADK7_9MICR|nr:methionyl-tRNA synthetase [Nosema pernyi]
MKLSISNEFEDLNFALSIFDPNLEIVSCEEGIILEINEKFEGLDSVFKKLTEIYNFNKSLKDFKRIRKTQEIEPIIHSFFTLISFYYQYKKLLIISNLKQINFLKGVSDLFNLDYLFFYLLNIQVGLIKEVEEVEGSDNLFLEKVDFGNTLQIVSGVRQLISKEDFVGHKFLFITNIKPSKVMGIPSNGMILCGKEDDKIVPIKVKDDIPIGTRLLLEKGNNINENLINVIDLKKSFFKNLFDKLEVKNGFIEFEGLKGVLKGELYESELKNGIIS